MRTVYRLRLFLFAVLATLACRVVILAILRCRNLTAPLLSILAGHLHPSLTNARI